MRQTLLISTFSKTDCFSNRVLPESFVQVLVLLRSLQMRLLSWDEIFVKWAANSLENGKPLINAYIRFELSFNL